MKHPTIGNIVRKRRQTLGWSLAALAQAAECSKAYLSAIENERLDNPPSRAVLRRLEAALSLNEGDLVRRGEWQRTPEAVRAELAAMAEKVQAFRELIGEHAAGRKTGGKDLDALYQSGDLRGWIDQHAGNMESPRAVGMRVPVINKVAAGYPTDFTDMEYPARVADEYAAVPDLDDAGAFAARVVGESMMPEYREGETIVFSPDAVTQDGCDCFVRLLPDHTTTFKRVYFEADDRLRLQPLNPEFEPKVVHRDEVAGLYPAVARIQPIGPGRTPAQTGAGVDRSSSEKVAHHKGSPRPDGAQGRDATT